MAVKLTSLAHKTAIRLHLVAGSRTICCSSSRRPVRKLLETPSYVTKCHKDLRFGRNLSQDFRNGKM